MSVERVRNRSDSIFKTGFGYTSLKINRPDTDKAIRAVVYTVHLGDFEKVKEILGVKILDVGNQINIDEMQYNSIMEIVDHHYQKV